MPSQGDGATAWTPVRLNRVMSAVRTPASSAAGFVPTVVALDTNANFLDARSKSVGRSQRT
jgi:hypothetical protein